MSLHENLFTITSVHDGDTVKGNLDLGYYLGLVGVDLRLFGINAPELVNTVAGHRVLNPAGENSTLHLLDLLGGRDLFSPKRTPSTFGIPGNYLVLPTVELKVVVQTRLVKGDDDYDKYGRILGEVTVPSGLNVGQKMITDGYAVPM
jgi:endonuclease YncB( thermonuclease family)